ncbi:MAG TPA: 8-amino-7-oxononanoate synthase [Nocardioidaceae bacterium]
MSLDDWLVRRRSRREEAGLQRFLHTRPATSDVIDLAGNDYLGLSRDPRVTAAAAEAASRWGAGAGASRLVTGTHEIHNRLEHALADFTGHAAALVFSTGYHANLGVVSALADADTLLVSDAHVHASLVDACRLARAGGLTITPHNDLTAVEEVLRTRSHDRALVLVESVYSVLGDAAPLVELAGLVDAYDAVLLVDEAHAVGVAGKDGSGLVATCGLAGRPDVVTTMTLSKALGSQGGAVLGSTALVDHLVNTARPFIFDTGLAPAAAGGALAALGVLRDEPGLPHDVLATACRLADAAGVDQPAAAVLSVPMGSPQEALSAQHWLAGEGVQVGCFRPPSVPDGMSRLRVTARADLAPAEVALACRLLRHIERRR